MKDCIDCKICSCESQFIFEGEVLNKYMCSYYYCTECGFLQTEKPYWLQESYSESISLADTGIIQRNINLHYKSALIFKYLFGSKGSYVDFAGGYGIYTRLMRDIGFDFYWSDKYTENVVARGFEFIEGQGEEFNAVTAFEAFEHLENPIEFISECFRLSNSKTILFSTELFNHPPPEHDKWWYYLPSTGQHISFYQVKTLEYIAHKNGINLYTNNGLHLFTDKKISKTVYKILTSKVLVTLLKIIPKRFLGSMTKLDHDKHVNNMLEKNK